MLQKLLVSLLLLLTVLLSSCEKDIGNVGLKMMPSEDILTVRLDSLTNFNFKYIRDNVNDTIRTSQYSLLLGSYIDPVFGKVRSEIYAPIYFSNPVLDTKTYSFEIINANVLLTYTDTSFSFGKNISQFVSVYQILDEIDTADYKTLNFTPREKPMGSFSLNIDTAITSDSTVSFPLPTEFISIVDSYIRKAINDTSYVYSISVGPDEINKVFCKKFYGLHLKTNFEDASIIKLKDIKIDLAIKRWTSDNVVDTVTQEMILSDFIDRENYIYKHPLVKFELKPSVTVTENEGKSNQKRVFIQTMKGYKAEFLFPDLQRWLDTTKVIINSARLSIPIEKNTAFPAISKLLLNVYEYGKVAPIFTFSSQTIGDNDQYIFYISSYISYFMKTAKAASNYRYEIVVPNNNLYVNRSILLPDQAKLHLTYTKYK